MIATSTDAFWNLAEFAPWLDELGHALFQSTWQIALLGAAYWLVERTGISSRLRHDLGLAMLCCALLWPALGLLQPEPLRNTTPSDGATTPAAAVAATGSPNLADETGRPATTPSIRLLLAPALSLLWLVGSAAMVARLLLGLLGLRRLRRLPSAGDATTRLQDRLTALGPRIGLGAGRLQRLTVRVPETAVQVGTCTFGVLRPTLLLPLSTFTGLSPAHLDAILLHELAHLRRRDAWFATLQSALDCLLFFHPVARWISRRVSVHREFACDELVLQAGVDRRPYAEALVALTRTDWSTTWPALAAPRQSAKGGSMAHRIQRIIEPAGSSRARIGSPRIALAFTLLLLLGPIAMATVLAKSSPGPGGTTPSAAATISTPETGDPPQQILLSAEVVSVDPAALEIAGTTETPDGRFAHFNLTPDIRGPFRTLIQETLSAPRIMTAVGGPATIQTGLTSPVQLARSEGGLDHSLLLLEVLPRLTTGKTTILDLEVSIGAQARSQGALEAQFEGLVVARDTPIVLIETGTGGEERDLYAVVLMAEVPLPKLEQPVTFAVKEAPYSGLLDTILHFVELERDDSAVQPERFERPITVQAEEVAAGEMLEIVLRMNCLRADLDDTTARIFEIPGCEPSPVYTRLEDR